MQGLAKNNRRVFAAAYVPLFCAGLMGLYVKRALMHEYWLPIARLAGGNILPVAERVAYFASDILLGFVILPLSVIAVAWLICRKNAVWIALAVSVALMVFYFIQLQAQLSTGQYISFSLMQEALRFTISDPELAGSYASRSALFKLVVFVVFTALSAGSAWYAGRFAFLRFVGAAYMRVAVGCAALMVLAAVLHYPYQQRSGLHGSAMRKIASAVFEDYSLGHVAASGLPESMAAFRKLTKTPARDPSPAIKPGMEKNSNVLLFIMETGPADVFPDGDASELIPDALRNNSLVALSHQTTYPYTSDAIYSILSGFYPAGRRQVVAHGGFKKHQAFFNRLRKAGAVTAAYVPNVYNEEVDEAMLLQFGMSTVFTADQAPRSQALTRAEAQVKSFVGSLGSGNPYFEQARIEELRSRMTKDVHALEQMKVDMRNAVAKGRRFGYLFLPQIGHGPWLRLGSSSGNRQFGNELMRLQKAWLESVVSLLAETGALEHTLIVMTADHGVRTRIEDPEFQAGTISSYSFHVPLFVYAPSTFSQHLRVNHLTSHVDIEPSLTAMLGLDASDSPVQGVPLRWQAPDRRLYFFAGDYGGADGFFDGRYFMRNLITETEFRSPRMAFSPSDILSDPQDREYVKSALSGFREIHHAIIPRL